MPTTVTLSDGSKLYVDEEPEAALGKVEEGGWIAFQPVDAEAPAHHVKADAVIRLDALDAEDTQVRVSFAKLRR